MNVPTGCAPWQVFAPLGVLSGVFFVVSMASTIFAIQFLGLSTAAGLWSGTAGMISTAGPRDIVGVSYMIPLTCGNIKSRRAFTRHIEDERIHCAVQWLCHSLSVLRSWEIPYTSLVWRHLA